MVKRLIFFAVLAAIATLSQAATMEDEVRAVFDTDIALQNLEERYKRTWHRAVERRELRIISVSRRVAQVYAPTQLTVGGPGVAPSKTRLYINLVMVKKPEGWQIVSILPILVPPQ